MADASITLPLATLVIRVYKGSVPDCIVMNTLSSAITEYLNYSFNSMTKFNGVYLLADQNGIYAQDDSNTDNDGIGNYPINAHIKSGRSDLYVNDIQRLRNAWLSCQTDGDIRFVTGADKKATRYYLLPYNSALSGIIESRVKFEKGIRNRYFDFKVQNINGSQLEIEGFSILTEPIISKRR